MSCSVKALTKVSAIAHQASLLNGVETAITEPNLGSVSGGGRYRHVAAWNGGSMLIWGGQTPQGGGYRDGAIYRP